MERVFTFDTRPIDLGHWIAIAIGEPSHGQRHIGVVHCDDRKEADFLHLAWHCKLRNDPPPPYLRLWVSPNIPIERQRTIAAFCRRVWRKNQKDGLPYAFSAPSGSFDLAGTFLIGESQVGLTCASFVLAIFHAAGVQLARYESWPTDRDGDREWQQFIIDELERQKADEQHISNIRGEVGSVRFRPEEVAASTAFAPPPTAFQDAESLGEAMVSRIRELGST